jgi:hypothetical protein
MARYSLTFQSLTPEAKADTSAMTTGKYCFLQGNSSTMQLKVNEVQAGGEASSSSVNILVFARDTTVAVTSIVTTSTNNALMDATATAPGTVALYGSGATTGSQRSATAHLIQHSFNGYGGLVRWQARQGEEITIVGNTQPLGECSYSGFTGCQTTAANSGHIIYELV